MACNPTILTLCIADFCLVVTVHNLEVGNGEKGEGEGGGGGGSESESGVQRKRDP